MMGEESIYNLIPVPTYKERSPPRHKSHFSTTVREETKSNKLNSKTMGPAKVQVADPKEFLTKRSKEPQTGTKTKFNYPDESTRRPAVPKHTEKPLMGVKSNKNFITTNAVENIMSVPKKPEKKFADTRGGATHPLDPSGLTPKYVNKKEYGATPTYLRKRKEDIQRAQAEYDSYVQEKFRQGAMRSLTNAQRQNMIDGLKKNWEELHHQYQGLSVVTDTTPKKNRKERMEAELKQLEMDIDLLEKHTVIYINH